MSMEILKPQCRLTKRSTEQPGALHAQELFALVSLVLLASVGDLESLGAKEHFQRKERWITKKKQKKETRTMKTQNASPNKRRDAMKRHSSAASLVLALLAVLGLAGLVAAGEQVPFEGSFEGVATVTVAPGPAH